MSLGSWSKSEVEQGRGILHSAWRGARSGQKAFLNGMPLSGFLGESVRTACPPAAVGVCIGLLASYSAKRRSVGRALTFASLGGAIGFGATLAWKSRGLTASTVREAARNVRTVRGERWMRKHSIAYA